VSPVRLVIWRAFTITSIQGSRWREVTGKMTRIDIYPMYDAGVSELNNGVIVAAVATAAGLPAIHPFTVIIKFIINKDSRLWFQHSLASGEELICT